MIEIIATLVMVGVLAVFTLAGIARFYDSYFFTKDNAAAVQTAQLAMARMIREFTNLDSITSSTSTSITYDVIRGAGSAETHTISWDGTEGSPLTMNFSGTDYMLTDDVNNLTYTYVSVDSDGVETTSNTYTAPADPESRPWTAIDISLTMNTSSTPTFNVRVFPRNLNRY